MLGLRGFEVAKVSENDKLDGEATSGDWRLFYHRQFGRTELLAPNVRLLVAEPETSIVDFAPFVKRIDNPLVWSGGRLWRCRSEIDGNAPFGPRR